MENLRLDPESQQVLMLLQRQDRRLQALISQVQDIIEGNSRIAIAVLQRLQQLETKVKSLEEQLKKKSKKEGEKK